MDEVELSGEARRLIESAGRGHEPNIIDRARVRRSVERRLAAGVILTVAQMTPVLSATAKMTLALVVTGAVAGTGAYFGARVVGGSGSHASSTETRLPERRSPASATDSVAPPAMNVDAPALPTKKIAAATPSRIKHRESRPVPVAAPTPAPEALPDLGAEMLSLQAVNAALGRKQVAQALVALSDYDRRFKGGQLAEERTALGVLALCAAGRDDEAIREHQRFRVSWPKSPLEARLITSCAAPAQERK